MTFLAAFAIILLPRQFHVTAVENASGTEIRRAAWLFPAYLVAINIFVIPIAIAGLLVLPPGSDADTFVLALPVNAGSQIFAMIAFIGGLSASTAMVIVECIALSIMVCNNLVVPLLLRQRDQERVAIHNDMGERLIAHPALGHRAGACARLWLLPDDRRLGGAGAGGPHLLCCRCAIRACLLRRSRVEARHGARRHGGHHRRICRLALHASAAVLRRCRLDRPRLHRRWPHGPRGAQAAHALLHGIRSAHPRRAVEPDRQYRHLCGWSRSCASPPPSSACRRQASCRARSAGPGAGFRLWRTAVTAERLEATVARYIGRGARARCLRRVFRPARRPGARCGQEADIRLFRFAEHLLASAVGRVIRAAGDRAHAGAPFDPCARRHAAARRCLRRHPVQPRPPAVGHRQRGPGHRRLRPGHDADLLEQPVPGLSVAAAAR